MDASVKVTLIGLALVLSGDLFTRSDVWSVWVLGMLLYVLGAIFILGAVLRWARRFLGGPVDETPPQKRL